MTTALRRLARIAGVSDRYHAAGERTEVPDATLRAVLSALEHPCDDDDATRRSLRRVRRAAWTRDVDPVAVVWSGQLPAPVTISAPADAPPVCRLTLEDGTVGDLDAPVWGGVAETDAGPRRRGTIALPTGLPLGYHRLTIGGGARGGATPRNAATADGAAPLGGSCTVIVAPAEAPQTPSRRTWGWMAQVYAVRSQGSWGQGEFTDLGQLAEWAAADGADFVLVNPLHAPSPTMPQASSPYSPSSRRYLNPCYLHVPAVAGFDDLDSATRAQLEDLPPALDARSARIDRDAVWAAKRAALWEVYLRLDPDGVERLAEYRRSGGVSLQRYALFCALAERHGGSFVEWPSELQHPDGEAVAAWESDHDDQVAFHAWLQLLCDTQARDAQAGARAAGMTIGIVHDLAVGATDGGADVWSEPDGFARTMHIGAPPDAFNQHGQDWGLPPPRPDTMRATGHRMFAEMLGAAFRVGGGLRIDHILGFSRLFWIPADAGPSAGTYVRYPADELFAVVGLEAARAGAVVIGEDLGTVDSRIRRLMRDRGVAGCAVLWFEGDPATPSGRRHAEAYPRHALASITTHDLPTATGWWDGSALRTRVELDLLTQPIDDAEAELRNEQQSMLELLRSSGALPSATAGLRERVVAMHRFLATTPTTMVAAALWDAVGDRRQPNVPGTVDAYPNWRLPLAVQEAGSSRPITLEELTTTDRIADVVDVLRDNRA